MMRAYSRRFSGSVGASLGSPRISEKPRMALSGVRNSWLMLASRRSFSDLSSRASSRAASTRRADRGGAALSRNAETSAPSLPARPLATSSSGNRRRCARSRSADRARASRPSATAASWARNASAVLDVQPIDRGRSREDRRFRRQLRPALAVDARSRGRRCDGARRNRPPAPAGFVGVGGGAPIGRGRRMAKTAPKRSGEREAGGPFRRRRASARGGGDADRRRPGATAAARTIRSAHRRNYLCRTHGNANSNAEAHRLRRRSSPLRS